MGDTLISPTCLPSSPRLSLDGSVLGHLVVSHLLHWLPHPLWRARMEHRLREVEVQPLAVRGGSRPGSWQQSRIVAVPA